jgi:hypothetical protein
MQIDKLIINRCRNGSAFLSYKLADRGYHHTPPQIWIEKDAIDSVIKELQQIRDHVDIEQEDNDEVD